MSKIEEFLRTDHDNARVALDWLAEVDPALRDVIEQPEALYETALRAFGQVAADDAEQRVIRDVAGTIGLTPGQLEQALSEPLKDEGPDREAIQPAKLAWDRRWSRRARGFLVSQLGKDYMFAITD